jgi:hypothetical protein
VSCMVSCEQVVKISCFFNFGRFCHLPKEELERHPMNQNILINHG